jgi:ABC-2 type transport system permease protein
MRIIMVKGEGLGAITGDLIILSVYGIIIFALGIHLFRRQG